MKMKKKDIIINILCVLWIILVLILKFNGEYTVEPVTDIERLAEEYYSNRLLEYAIYEYRSELLGDDMEGWVDGQGEKAYLIIMEDGRVYFWNTYRHLWGLFPDETYEDVTCSAYYMGQLSSLDLWFFRWNRDMIETDRGYDNGDEAWGVYPEPGEEILNRRNDASNRAYVDIGENMEKRKEEYDCIVYGIDSVAYGFLVEECSITNNYKKTSNDLNATIAINFLRNTWHYREYIDLMYQELYPWLVEE